MIRYAVAYDIPPFFDGTLFTEFQYNSAGKDFPLINPFVPDTLFLNLPKTLENLKVFCCF